jgi:hypothetical protein
MRLATFACVLVLAAAVGAFYAPVWQAGARTHTPFPREPGRYGILAEADHRYAVWAVDRNARALLARPLRFFAAEACFPTPNGLALGEPLITMGLLAVGPHALSGDPELTYNVVLVAMASIAGLAMFLLVRDLTASAPAALAAALFFLFSRGRFGEIVHPFAGDTSWAVAALYFSRRLFAGARWRDAIGLAIALALQVGTSVYPLTASALVGVPFAVWLLLRHPFPASGALKLALPAAACVGALAFLVVPVMALREGGAFVERQRQFFAESAYFLPGGMWFQGWSRDLLAIAGLLVPWRFVAPPGPDPRRALLLGAVLSLAAAMGPLLPDLLGLPREWNFWNLLAALLPPLRNVRSPAAVVLGFDLAMDVLAGCGFAGLLGMSRRFGAVLPAVALLLPVTFDVGRSFARMRPVAFRLQPSDDQIGFFARLARAGNAGPIFEWPNPAFDPTMVERLTLATYHGRPTSSCFASFASPQTRRVIEIGKGLPGRDALRKLRAEGFTTLLVHHEAEGAEKARALFLPVVLGGRERSLRLIATSGSMTAYAIEVPWAGRAR